MCANLHKNPKTTLPTNRHTDENQLSAEAVQEDSSPLGCCRVDEKQKGMYAQNQELFGEYDQCLQASVSVLLSNTIFSPGLNAGMPKYGQLAHRKASPK